MSSRNYEGSSYGLSQLGFATHLILIPCFISSEKQATRWENLTSHSHPMYLSESLSPSLSHMLCIGLWPESTRSMSNFQRNNEQHLRRHVLVHKRVPKSLRMACDSGPCCVYYGVLSGNGSGPVGRQLRDLPFKIPGVVRGDRRNSQLGRQPHHLRVLPLSCQRHWHLHDVLALWVHIRSRAAFRHIFCTRDKRSVVSRSRGHVGGTSPRSQELAPRRTSWEIHRHD